MLSINDTISYKHDNLDLDLLLGTFLMLTHQYFQHATHFINQKKKRKTNKTIFTNIRNNKQFSFDVSNKTFKPQSVESINVNSFLFVFIFEKRGESY